MVQVMLAGGAVVAAAPLTRAFAQEATPSASPVAAEFPLTVTTANGTTELAAAAERVVALSFPDVDTVVALGVTPVGVQPDPFTETGIPVWLTDALLPDETTVLNITEEVPLEDVVALNPDLIIDTLGSRSASVFDTMNAIAPTLSGLPELQVDVVTDRTRLIGQLLGKSAEAEAVLASVDAGIEAFKAEFPQLEGTTFAFGTVRSAEAIGVIREDSHFAVQLFSRFGMSVTPALRSDDRELQGTAGAVSISLEEIQLIESDVVFLAYGSAEVQAEIEASPLYQSLSTVQRGNFIAIPLEMATAMNVPSVANIPWTLDQLREMFHGLDFVREG